MVFSQYETVHGSTRAGNQATHVRDGDLQRGIVRGEVARARANPWGLCIHTYQRATRADLRGWSSAGGDVGARVGGILKLVEDTQIAYELLGGRTARLGWHDPEALLPAVENAPDLVGTQRPRPYGEVIQVSIEVDTAHAHGIVSLYAKDHVDKLESRRELSILRRNKAHAQPVITVYEGCLRPVVSQFISMMYK